MKKVFLLSVSALLSVAAFAQDDILVGKPVYTLGDAKSWISSNGATYTFVSDDLSKLVLAETNKSNIFLFPEDGGGWDTPENRLIGIQGFYVDLGEVQPVGTITTTWEGAAANSYSIYLTDVEPTLDILATQPTYSASKLGQYTTNVAVLPDNSEGRYLVFQPTDATNWGWGVKIRSISATAPADDILTKFTVSPGIVASGLETAVTLSFLNQFGLAINADEVTIAVSGDGNFEYADGKLKILSGTYAEFSASMGDVTLTSTVYAAVAPELPAATSIKTPIFSNTVTDYNGDVEWTVGYNGGAVNNGLLEFENGEVAQSFGNTRCVFFSNKTTTGAWNGNIDPAANGYRSLNLDVFSSKSVQCSIEFESVTGLDGHTFYFDLTAGQWTPIEVIVLGASKLGNLSIRFTESNMTDILLSNIYFTPDYVEGDTEAPVLSEIKATPSQTSVELSFSATDDKNDVITYVISVADKTYNASGNSGETIEYTISGLNPLTTYEISVQASDGLNVSEPQTISVTTTGMPASPELASEDVDIVYSSWVEDSAVPTFDAWGSAAKMSLLETENGNSVLGFSDYNGQWGGLINLDIELGETSETLDFAVYTDGDNGTFDIAPVWADANGANTPGVKVEVKNGVWTGYSIPLENFGFATYGYTVIQLAFTNSTLASFAMDNICFSPKNTSGVENVVIAENELVTVVNLQGVVLRQNVSRENALNGLPAGIYIVDGKKFLKN